MNLPHHSEELIQDVRYGLRSMLNHKVFSTLTVLCLALGIGANTAIYSFMESILMRSLPVPEPESLIVMKWRAAKFTSASSKGMSWSTDGSYNDPEEGYIGTNFPFPALKLFQDNSKILAKAFCYFGGNLSVTVNDNTEILKSVYVSGDYFQGMGVPPAAGRLIHTSDDDFAAPSVAVLSHRHSERYFGEAARAVGQSIRINNKPFTVIGVASPEFFGAEPGAVPDVYVPIHAMPALAMTLLVGHAQYLEPNFYWIEIMGRLKPGVTLAQAQAALAPQFRRFVEETTSTERQREFPPELRLSEGAAGLDSLRRRYAKPVFVLMVMVGLILFIACANTANLLLARATARRREIAVRMSIGAGRLRVIRQLLTESVLLSSLGGILGVMFALWGIRVLTLLLANGRENFTLHAELNWHVLGVTFLISILTGLFFGIAPALHATRVDVMPVLKETVGAVYDRPGASRAPLQRILVITQIAFSLVLLTAAGLFGRTLLNLHSIELGFNRENVLLFRITPGAVGYEGAARTNLYQDLQQRLSQIPGVRSVGMSASPLPAGGGTKTLAVISGAPLPAGPGPDGRPPHLAGIFAVGPRFFETMQVPLIAGREIEDRDVMAGPAVAVINQKLARVFGLENPVGQTVTLGGRNPYVIVGLVGDALFLQLKEEIGPMAYIPYGASYGMTYELRAAGNPLGHAGAVREIVRQIDSRLAVADMKTQEAHIDQLISQEITLARLCTVFAALALIIACIGLYGTVAFNVELRTGEIGIRMALGAHRRGIVWLVLRQVLVLALVGLAIGIPVTLAGSRYVKSFLYGIEPNDPVSITGAVMLLLSTGLLAGYLPARRASRIDPMAAVRRE